MPEKQKINILWFTNNLRIRYKESLMKIQQDDSPFLAIYGFDHDFFQKQGFGFQKIGKFRKKIFIVNSFRFRKEF